MELFVAPFVWPCLAPILGGAVFQALCVWAMLRFRRRPAPQRPEAWPAVSVLKPVHGLEKNLRENLRTACLQDYPNFQVVFSVQRRDDPAISLLREIEAEFGRNRVTVVVEERNVGANEKINNLVGALPHARHDVLVLSDSDMRLESGYLKAIVAPLLDPEVGFVCTLYRAAEAGTWFEKLELLSLNAEFIPSLVFAYETGASDFCLGATTALRRETLEKVGSFEALASHFVEDYELGRRIAKLGLRSALVPFIAETMVDLKTPRDWWNHQVYWDQNTRSARPLAFLSTILVRPAPFVLLFAALRGGDAIGLGVLAASVAWRLVTSAAVLGRGLGDREGLRALYLLPLRDLLGFVSWLAALVQRRTRWRGETLTLDADGRLLPKQDERVV